MRFSVVPPKQPRDSARSIREVACESVDKFYRLPPGLLAFVCFGITILCYFVLPRVLGIPVVLLLAFVPLYETLLRRSRVAAHDENVGLRMASERADREGGAPLSQDKVGLDLRQMVIAGLGIALAAVVLPLPHLGLFAINGLFAYWLGLRPWDWVRKYGCFFMVETVYLYLKFQLPRPGYEHHFLFSHVLPHGVYFAFLWSGIELVAFIKLLDFVLWAKPTFGSRARLFGRFVLFLFYPFAFLAGPVVGFEDLFKSYRLTALGSADLFYSLRKCLWGSVQVSVFAVWLHGQALWLRQAVLDGQPITQVVDSRILMWLWLAAMSVLLQLIYKGYVDVMLGLSRLAGFALPEQFWFTLFAKDPVEYWQNGNRSVYKFTNYHIFNRFFDRRKVAAKTVMAVTASGVFHVFLCPTTTWQQGMLLAVLFATNGVIVALFLRLRTSRFAELVHTFAPEGTARNALIITGVLLTFTILTFTRSGFLLMVEGVSVAQWWQLMGLLVVPRH